MMKHVGKHNQRKCVLLFREVPGDEDMCLIVYTDLLPNLIHDPMMKCIEGDVGQNSNDISGPLNRTLMDNGKNVLNALHAGGHIRKVPTNQMILQPNAQTTIRLDELNKILREMEDGKKAGQRMTEIVEESGGALPTGSEADLSIMGKTDTVIEPIVAEENGVLTDAGIAQGQLQQAAAMEADAKRLLAEAKAIQDEAYTLAPELKPKATRKAPVKKAATAKRGPGRPKKNASAPAKN